MRKKVNIFLWVVVFAYLIYAIAEDGLTAKLAILAAGAVLAAVADFIGQRRKR